MKKRSFLIFFLAVQALVFRRSAVLGCLEQPVEGGKTAEAGEHGNFRDRNIRLKCENGQGRVTPGKRFSIWNGEREINLGGTWLYRIGAVCEQITPTDFVNWKPTGLYHGMVAPCHAYTIAGVLWYQGEANAHMPACSRYGDLKRRLTGITTVSFLVHQKIHIRGFSFTCCEKAWMQLEAKGADSTYGDSFELTEQGLSTLIIPIGINLQEIP